jgi:hypothetical protein
MNKLEHNRRLDSIEANSTSRSLKMNLPFSSNIFAADEAKSLIRLGKADESNESLLNLGGKSKKQGVIKGFFTYHGSEDTVPPFEIAMSYANSLPYRRGMPGSLRIYSDILSQFSSILITNKSVYMHIYRSQSQLVGFL